MATGSGASTPTRRTSALLGAGLGEHSPGHLFAGPLLHEVGDGLVRRLEREEVPLAPPGVGDDAPEPDLFVDLSKTHPREPAGRRDRDRPGPCSLLDQTGEVQKAEGRHLLAHVAYGHLEAQVGLVRAIALHRLSVLHPGERAGHLHSEEPDEPLEERLHEVVDGLLRGEGGLDVDLRELGLPIGSQVLVAEAAHDLEVAVEARDHQELLEELRRLGQGVVAAVVDARGNEVVAGAFRRRLGQHGRLDLEEALLVHVAANLHRDLVTQREVLLHHRAAQVEVAVLEADVLAGVDVVLDGKDRGPGLVEDPDLSSQHLDLPRGESGVHRVGGALGNLSDDREDVLRTHFVGRGMSRLGDLRTRHDLADPLAVAQINEDDAPEVPACGRPPHEGHRLPHVLGPQDPAVVCADEVALALSHSSSP